MDDTGARKGYELKGEAYELMTQIAEGEQDKDLCNVLSGEEALVYKGKDALFTPFCALKDIADRIFEEEDCTAICAEQDMPIIGENENVTVIKIASTELEFASVEEFVDTIAQSRSLKNRFSIEVEGEAAAEDMVPVSGKGKNKIEGYVYDTSLYIPYTTTDNFARHLAQYCFYTSLQS